MIRMCMGVCVGYDCVALIRGRSVFQVVYKCSVCDMNMYVTYMIRVCMACVALVPYN